MACLVDNCSAHTHVEGPKNICLYFLLANTMPVFQPCDMGMIRAPKVYRMHEKIIDIIDDKKMDTSGHEVVKSIQVLHAMHKLSGA